MEKKSSGSMVLNALAHEIHRNAIMHGWWKEPRAFGELLALVHSELSEALEEYRDNMPLVWLRCTATDEGGSPVCNGDCTPCKQGFTTNFVQAECIYQDEKPEGIAIELVDAVIRILDIAAQYDSDVDEAICHFRQCYKATFVRYTKPDFERFPDLINLIHDIVAEASHRSRIYNRAEEVHFYENSRYSTPFTFLAGAIDIINDYLQAKDMDMVALIRQKHEYNQTRPYRHGGKMC